MIFAINSIKPIIPFRANETATTQKKSGKANTTIFYVNDIHGIMGNMSRIYTAKNAFDKTPQQGDVLVLGSGDISAGANSNIVKISDIFLNSIKADATTLGNHEFDANPDQIADAHDGSRYKYLGLNIDITGENNPLEKHILKSTIKEIDGNKYGIIGLIPPDLHKHIRDNKSKETIQPYTKEQTLQSLQEEVNKLKAQGVNKIIVLSHCGLQTDKEFAKNTEGVDVILSAHTHELIKGIDKDINLLLSKSNEPVILTQAGKDGEQFGILNLEFNENGVITKAQNSIQKSSDFKRNLIMERVFDEIVGGKDVVGYVEKSVPAPKDRLIDPNPHGYLIADACRKMLGTDLALINAGNIRGYFEEGTLTERKVFEVSPLKNRMVTLNLTEAEIIEAIKRGANSLNTPDHKYGLIFPSGMEYKISTSGKLLSASFIDKDGIKHPIDVERPDKTKIYSVAADDFFAAGCNDYIDNKLDQLSQKFDFDKDKLTCDYIRQAKKPIQLKDDGRIKILEA